MALLDACVNDLQSCAVDAAGGDSSERHTASAATGRTRCIAGSSLNYDTVDKSPAFEPTQKQHRPASAN